MVNRILFTRHGETEDNIIRRLSTSPPGPKLTNLGKKQAINLGNKIKDINIDIIYSSPLVRAMQTAKLIIGNRKIKIHPQDGLKELSVGVLEGRNDDEAFAELDKIWHSWTVERNLDVLTAEGGETANQILERSVKTFNNIIKNNQFNTVLIVAHSGILQLLIPEIAENIPYNFGVQNWLRNCQLVDLIRKEDKFICVSWGDIKL